jgi:uncharacterized Zn finger protein
MAFCDLYCPACGETSEGAGVELLAPNPGELLSCPACGTEYRVRVDFFTIGEED